MLALFRVHAAHDVELVRDARAARHERGKMHARNRSRDAAERPARWSTRFRIPRFKLTRRAAQPEQDDFLLRALRGLCEERIRKQAREARYRGGAGGGETFEKKAPMQPVVVGGGGTGVVAF